MAREWTLTRTKAEFLVDVLEGESKEDIGSRLELADQLRELFGMGQREDHPSLTAIASP
jgi:hypothetical protein